MHVVNLSNIFFLWFPNFPTSLLVYKVFVNFLDFQVDPSRPLEYDKQKFSEYMLVVKLNRKLHYGA